MMRRNVRKSSGSKLFKSFVDSLEMRKHLAVTANAFHDTLYVWGDSSANGISVEKSGSNLVVKQYVSGSGYVSLFSVAEVEVDSVRVYGYDGPDTVSINDNVTKATWVYGGRGADWIKGGGGTNSLWGHGDWADDPSGSHKPSTDDSATDTIVGGKGSNALQGQKGNDTLISRMTGSTGDANPDVLLGGDGNDTLVLNGLGSGVGFAYGEAGNDTFKVMADNQEAYLYGANGVDTVDYSDFDKLGKSVIVQLDTTVWSGVFAGGPRRQLIASTMENVIGTSQADTLKGNASANVLNGKGGHDLIYGLAGNDVLIGDTGNDAFEGGSGNDLVSAGSGDDNVLGGSGNDSIYGGAGNDNLKGESGNDSLYGEAGTDWLYGGTGSDLLAGGADADYLESHDGSVLNDLLYGGNVDGSGNGGGAIDVAYIDRTGGIWADLTFSVESIAS